MQRRIWLERLSVPLMLLPALLVLFLLFSSGMIVGIGQSLGYMPVIGLQEFTLQHYVDVLTDSKFLQSLWLTFRIAFVTTLLSIIFAILLALVLRKAFRGSQFATFIFQIPDPDPTSCGRVWRRCPGHPERHHGADAGCGRFAPGAEPVSCHGL